MAVVYDCLYPATIGGAERWLARLAEALAADHEVTYITRRQWNDGDQPLPGVECVAVSPGGALHRPDGSRRPLPVLLFGLGVFAHLLRRRRYYDVVHCLSYPYLALIATRRLGGTRARSCLRMARVPERRLLALLRARRGADRPRARTALRPHHPEAVVFSRLSARRLGRTRAAKPAALAWRARRAPRRLGAVPRRARASDGPVAGRHVRDKGVTALPDALALARARRPDLTAVIAGDGPQREQVLERLRSLDWWSRT